MKRMALWRRMVVNPSKIARMMIFRLLLPHLPFEMYILSVAVVIKRAKMPKPTSFQGDISSSRTIGLARIIIAEMILHFLPAISWIAVNV